MTESVDATQMQIVYDKFIALRKRQKVANQKYRATDYGKKKTNEMHRVWCSKKKDDLEYNNNINMKARERYRIRKNKKLALLTEKEICLGENQEKEM